MKNANMPIHLQPNSFGVKDVDFLATMLKLKRLIKEQVFDAHENDIDNLNEKK